MFMPIHVYVCMYVCSYIYLCTYSNSGKLICDGSLRAKSAKFGYFCLASREGSGTCLARALKTH